jgi:NAD(P)-dependent dehydrogenase (short-subunit alcohol dehydrogenase family)
MSDFEGLVAAVTGGASGIGAATADLLRSRGATVAVLDLSGPVTCDVRDAASVDAAIGAVVAEHGRLDILINNAGIGAAGDVTANSDDEWRNVLEVNVIGMARVARAAIPHLRRSASPAIVNTSSIAALVGLPQRALYSASKGAVAALTLAMAAARTALQARQPIGRLVTAEEVAGAIVYLASPLSSATTGTLLPVDGGVMGLRIPPRPAG